MYDLKDVNLPVVTGVPLRMFASTCDNMPGVVVPSLRSQGGVQVLNAADLHGVPPTALPRAPVPATQKDAAAGVEAMFALLQDLKQAGGGPQREWPTVAEYHSAYLSGKTTPTRVAQAFLAAKEIQGSCFAFCSIDATDVLKQAEEATARFAAGEPLSLLDGVPVAIKDEVDVAGHATFVGTRFLGNGGAKTADSFAVARMRAAGALLVGKTAMHEIGIGVTGNNPNYADGFPRNPYNLTCYTGGSSSGSAAAVAAGLCPLALGADGGGSIRIPAALCGIVGLKPTFGRVSEAGAFPICSSVAHIGPMAASVADAAAGYAAMAGPNPDDDNTLPQPAVEIGPLDRTDLSGLTVGIVVPYNNHSDPEIRATCDAALEHLSAMGVVVKEVQMPELDLVRVAHVVTILSEMIAGISNASAKDLGTLNPETRINLAIARSFTGLEFVKAQQVRTKAMRMMAGIFRECDVLFSPATGVVAPEATAAAAVAGESNATTATKIMRFSFLANLTGIPAISLPIGYSRAGLPIGGQFAGPHWSESRLLQVAAALERKIETKAPVCTTDLLKAACGDGEVASAKL